MTAQEIEKAFFDHLDFCLEDYENFHNGFEDAWTAFNEDLEDEEPFDVAEMSFTAGANHILPQAQEQIKTLDDRLHKAAKKIEAIEEINDRLHAKIKALSEELEAFQAKFFVSVGNNGLSRRSRCL